MKPLKHEAELVKAAILAGMKYGGRGPGRPFRWQCEHHPNYTHLAYIRNLRIIAS